MDNESVTIDRENILESPKKVTENSNDFNESYSAWVEDGIVKSRIVKSQQTVHSANCTFKV